MIREQSNEFVEISVEFVRETDRAVLIKEGKREIWLPKSQTKVGDLFNTMSGTVITFEVKEWLAQREGLI